MKARLTTDALEQESDPASAAEDDWTLKQLQRLFKDDPVVDLDETGWYPSGSALDAADADPDGRLRDTAEELLACLNGVHRLVTSSFLLPVARLTHEYEGRKDAGVRLRVQGISAYSSTLDDLDDSSARALLELSESDSEVALVLEFLASMVPLSSHTFWFDAYRVWDIVIRSGYPTDTVDGLGQDFEKLRERFEDSANNPNWDRAARHAGRYPPRKHRADGTDVEKLPREEALSFLRTVVAAWLERDHGCRVTQQA